MGLKRECSFCGKARHVVSGTQAAICVDCVRYCVEVFGEMFEAAGDRREEDLSSVKNRADEMEEKAQAMPATAHQCWYEIGDSLYCNLPQGHGGYHMFRIAGVNQ